MNKTALPLVVLTVAFALEGCVIFPVPGKRSEAGMSPERAKPHTTTRAKLLVDGLQPELRTPDDRFFLYGHTIQKGWKLCFAGFSPRGGPGAFCDPSVFYSERWVLVEFDDSGVVKEVTISKCKGHCGSAPQDALLVLLSKTYGSALAANYQQIYQQMLEHTLAFHQAAGRGDVQAVKKWLAQGVEVNARDSNSRTPLHEAALYGHSAVATLLLAHGADVNAGDNLGRTPLHEAASRQGNAAVVEALLVHGADANARDNQGRTPLHEAASRGYTDVATLFLAHGADVNARDNQGRTPLHEAASQGNAAVVEALLVHGADVNARDNQGHRPLHEAASRGYTDVAGVLRARTTDTLTEVSANVSLFPGETRASAAAQLKTAKLLDTRAADAGCHRWTIVDTKIITTHVAPKFVGDKLVEGSWTERWYMDRCGRSIPYTVNYSAHGKGGAEILLK